MHYERLTTSELLHHAQTAAQTPLERALLAALESMETDLEAVAKEREEATKRADTAERRLARIEAKNGEDAPEPLTVAYIAIGAEQALRESPALFNPDDWNGQLGFIGEAIEWAAMLDRMGDEYEDFSGVWAYEVAEEFGLRYGRALLTDVNGRGRAEDIARELVEAIACAEED